MCLIHCNYQNKSSTHCFLSNELHAKMHLTKSTIKKDYTVYSNAGSSLEWPGLSQNKSDSKLICYHVCNNKITKHLKFIL